MLLKLKYSLCAGLIVSCILMRVSPAYTVTSVPALITKLSAENQVVRTNAARELGMRSDARAVDPLLEALKDPDAGVRGAVVDALGVLKNRRSVSALADVLVNDREGEVRQLAAIALGSLRDLSAGGALIQGMNDEHLGTRLASIKSAGTIRSEEAVDTLLILMDDPGVLERAYAAEALGNIGHQKAVEILHKHLKDTAATVRAKSAHALGRLNAKKSTAGLKKLLKDQDGTVVISAAFALGLLKNDAGLRAARTFLSDPEIRVQKRAIEIYGLVGTRKDIPVLQDLADNNAHPAVRKAVRKAIRSIKQNHPEQ